MNVKDILFGFGGLLLAGAVVLMAIMIIAVFYYGAVWVSAKLLPWFLILSLITFGLVMFIILPLAISRTMRKFSIIALIIASYIFGATLWMKGLLLTLSIWGLVALIMGLILGGIGVVPIAMLATLIEGMWIPLIELVLFTIVTYGCWLGVYLLAESLEG